MFFSLEVAMSHPHPEKDRNRDGQRRFSLEPAERARLANLVGPEDENLHQIAQRLGVNILNTGPNFVIEGQGKAALAAERIIKQLYLETAPLNKQKKAPYITPDKVNLAIIENTHLEAAQADSPDPLDFYEPQELLEQAENARARLKAAPKANATMQQGSFDLDDGISEEESAVAPDGYAMSDGAAFAEDTPDSDTSDDDTSEQVNGRGPKSKPGHPGDAFVKKHGSHHTNIDRGSVGELYHKASTLKTSRGVVKARTPNQSQYISQIISHDISFGIGPAGTGKTFLAVAAAVDALTRNEVRRIILTRPAVEAGEKLGFLPGDLSQKVDPYLRPLYDALFEMLGFEKVEKFIERQIIEIAPLAYMRGRTLNDSFIILDEAQNTTIEQMKMFLTRIGFNSKAVITGDPSQIDLPRNVKSGLKHAIEVLTPVDSISFTYFLSEDVVRHPVVAAIVNAYEAYDKAHAHDNDPKPRQNAPRNLEGFNNALTMLNAIFNKGDVPAQTAAVDTKSEDEAGNIFWTLMFEHFNLCDVM